MPLRPASHSFLHKSREQEVNTIWLKLLPNNTLKGIVFYLLLRIQFWPAPPIPEFLSKDFCLEPGLEWKFLLSLPKENLVRAKIAPTAISRTFTPLLRKTNQVSLVRVHFSQPESDGKSSDVPRESFEVIFNLAGYLNSARLFLETLQRYPLKQAYNWHFQGYF